MTAASRHAELVECARYFSRAASRWLYMRDIPDVIVSAPKMMILARDSFLSTLDAGTKPAPDARRASTP